MSLYIYPKVSWSVMCTHARTLCTYACIVHVYMYTFVVHSNNDPKVLMVISHLVLVTMSCPVSI